MFRTRSTWILIFLITIFSNHDIMMMITQSPNLSDMKHERDSCFLIRFLVQLLFTIAIPSLTFLGGDFVQSKKTEFAVKLLESHENGLPTPETRCDLCVCVFRNAVVQSKIFAARKIINRLLDTFVMTSRAGGIGHVLQTIERTTVEIDSLVAIS